VSDSKPAATSVELEKLSHLAPQLQAERLLDLAIHRDERSLEIIHQRQDAWRGRLESTDRLFISCSRPWIPRIPVCVPPPWKSILPPATSASLRKDVAHLLNQLITILAGASLTLLELGALGNRGVEPAIVLADLLRSRTTQASRRALRRCRGLRSSRSRENPFDSDVLFHPGPRFAQNPYRA